MFLLTRFQYKDIVEELVQLLPQFILAVVAVVLVLVVQRQLLQEQVVLVA
jgi:hypothetical protein